MAAISNNTTMKKVVAALLLAGAFPSASAAPALVWKTQQQPNELFSKQTQHRSAEIPASKMLRDALNVAEDNSNNNHVSGLSVVFLVGRIEGGLEGLTALTKEGSLPGVASKYEFAETVHHHVSQMESLRTVTNDVASLVDRNNKGSSAVMQVSLEELSSKLEALQQQDTPVVVVEDATESMEVSQTGMVSKTVHSHNKRARALQAARFLIVDVPAGTDPARLDKAVVQAINAEKHIVDTVVLSAIRSTEEVKQERELLTRRRMMAMEEDYTHGGAASSSIKNRRRRLEDNNNQAADDANNNGQNAEQDMTGIYYVSMTPNILAGLLFTLLFAVVTWIGVSCMGMITGQDTYVSKMPSIGREA